MIGSIVSMDGGLTVSYGGGFPTDRAPDTDERRSGT